jgi:putative thioredoxin
MAEERTIIDVDTQGFEREVLQRSLELPVLLDFWAAWCGPCKTLGPILEKLARERPGAFVLARVDVDKEPRLADAFRIQSIPTVMLLVGGRPVDAFMGALPEAEIRRFLEPHLGPGGATDAVEQARAMAEEGDSEGAILFLREHLRQHPDDGPARIALARQLLDAGRREDAAKALERLDEAQRSTPEAKSVLAELELLAQAGDLGELRAKVAEHPDDLALRLELGKALFAARQHEEGLEEVFGAALVDLSFDEGAPRKTLIELFRALGPEHPLTLEYQQRLSVLLCS